MGTEIQEMGGRAAGDGIQRYRRWEVELQEMGDRDTGDERQSCRQLGDRGWEAEIQYSCWKRRYRS
jgi:hypothetical protein